MITITPEAKEAILNHLNEKGTPDLFVRITITGKAQGAFHFNLQMVPEDNVQESDVTVEDDGVKLVLDPESASQVEGSRLTLEETIWGKGLVLREPPKTWDDPLAQKVQNVIDETINPAIASHGGVVTLVKVEGSAAYIEMGGGCQGCGMADATLKQGIEVMIKDEVEEIEEVIDATDHTSGENPYYDPANGEGETPTG